MLRLLDSSGTMKWHSNDIEDKNQVIAMSFKKMGLKFLGIFEHTKKANNHQKLFW